LQRQLPKMTPSGLSMGVTRGLVRVNLVGVKRDLGQLPRTWVSPRGLVVSKRPSGCQKRPSGCQKRPSGCHQEALWCQRDLVGVKRDLGQLPRMTPSGLSMGTTYSRKFLRSSVAYWEGERRNSSMPCIIREALLSPGCTRPVSISAGLSCVWCACVCVCVCVCVDRYHMYTYM
jgi:hypothetical protein